VTLLAACTAGCGSATSAKAGAPAGVAPTSTTSIPQPVRGLAVSMSKLLLVDTSRPVVGDGHILARQRSLPTYMWTPAGTGPYPLVVFVHGFDVGPLTYQRFCSTLASSGYVVAAPSFPQEDPSSGFALDRGELPEEANDVSFVIGALEQGPEAEDLDGAQIAVVGHSDGADVALMVGYQQGTVDPRVRAIVADAPDPMIGVVVPSSAPLLLVQGTADSVVPYADSRIVFDQVSAPKYYVSLIGADHLPPIEGGTAWTPVLDKAVADFLDAAVADRGPGMPTLAGELGASPLVRLETG
jgi:dipeptidyl aminopeptidase/acylaminoacyl peptidase